MSGIVFIKAATPGTARLGLCSFSAWDWVCPEEQGKAEGLRCVQAAEGRADKPYSFGKRSLDEFLSAPNVFRFDNKGLCCVLSEDVYNLAPLPALMSAVTA